MSSKYIPHLPLFLASPSSLPPSPPNSNGLVFQTKKREVLGESGFNCKEYGSELGKGGCQTQQREESQRSIERQIHETGTSSPLSPPPSPHLSPHRTCFNLPSLLLLRWRKKEPSTRPPRTSKRNASSTRSSSQRSANNINNINNINNNNNNNNITELIMITTIR